MVHKTECTFGDCFNLLKSRAYILIKIDVIYGRLLVYKKEKLVCSVKGIQYMKFYNFPKKQFDHKGVIFQINGVM